MIIEQLSSLPDDTAALEPWTLTDHEVRELTRAVFAARAGLEELATRLTAAAEDRGLPREDGCVSATSWLAQVSGLSKRDASRLVALSRVDADLVEATRARWAAGTVSTEQAGIIIRAINELPDWIGDEERHDAQTTLLGHVDQGFGCDDLRRLANRIIEVIDPDGADEILGKQLEEQEKRALKDTHLRLVDDGEGTTRVKGQIPTAQAAMLRTALEAIAPPRRTTPLSETWGPHGVAEGHLNAQQRLGRAFCELIDPPTRRARGGTPTLPADKLPQAGGLPAVITIETTLDALKDALGTATLSTGDQISASQARRLACNAGLIPMVMGGDSKILDLAPTRRLHDRYQRHAIVKRDGGCCWKGCDRPPAWCEVHHPDPFAAGGPTTIDNGALFCHTHHHLLHDSDWTARLARDNIIDVIPPVRIDPHQRPLRHARHTKLQPRAA